MQPHQQRQELPKLRSLVERAKFHAPLERAEEAAILSLWRTAHHYPAGFRIEPSPGAQLITSGWAGWLRYASDGRRLIFLFLIPGDFIVPGLFEMPGCHLVCLTPLRTVDAASLADDEANAPRSFVKIKRSCKEYQLLILDHLTRLTMGSTKSSVASILCEFHQRSSRSGVPEHNRFSFPIGQRLLASSLGRSAVQVNKVMSQFQANEVIKVGYDWINILNPEKLAFIAGKGPIPGMNDE